MVQQPSRPRPASSIWPGLAGIEPLEFRRRATTTANGEGGVRARSRLPVDLRSDTVTRPTPRPCAGPWPRPRSGTTSSGGPHRSTCLQERVAALSGQGGGPLRPVGHHGQPALRAHPHPARRRGAHPRGRARPELRGRVGGGARRGAAAGAARGSTACSTRTTVWAAVRPRQRALRAAPGCWRWRTRTTAPAGRSGRCEAAGGGGRRGPRGRAGASTSTEPGSGTPTWRAGSPSTDYAAAADSVSVCFSKGLGAPVGSIMAGHARTSSRKPVVTASSTGAPCARSASSLPAPSMRSSTIDSDWPRITPRGAPRVAGWRRFTV